MTDVVARIVFHFCLLAAAAIWARGYVTVGDGFSAGALAGLGAALQYVALDYRQARRSTGAPAAPALLALGLLAALLVIWVPVLWNAPPVSHFPRPAQHVASFGTIELHTAAAFDLGIAVAVYGALVKIFDRLFPPLEGG